MNFNKTLIGAILGLVSDLWAFADWPMQGHDPAQTNCQTEGLGGMDSAPYLKWSWTHPFGARCGHQPIVGDIDGDGKGEILVLFNETGMWDPPQDTFLYCFNGENGLIKWKYKLTSGKEESFQPQGPVLADLDGDGLKEIIFTRWFSPRLVAMNGEDMSILWASSKRPEFVFPIDVEGDGQPEIMVQSLDSLHLLEGSTGNPRWGRALPGPSLDNRVSAGDMDGDGDEDIVFTDIDGGPPYIYIYDGPSGTLLISQRLWEIASSEVNYSPIVLADLDGDGALEAVLNTSTTDFPGRSTVRAFKWNTVSDSIILLWATEGNIGDYVNPTTTAVGDLDGDGALEIAVGWPDGLSVVVLNGRTGSVIGHGSGSRGIIGPVDEDPNLDLLNLCPDLYYWELGCIDRIDPWVEKWCYWYHGVLIRHFSLADVDGDGINEIVLGGERIMVLERDSTTNLKENTGLPEPVPRIRYSASGDFLYLPQNSVEAVMEIYDVMGYLRWKAGVHEELTPIPSLPGGTYMIFVKTQEKRHSLLYVRTKRS